MIRKIFAACIVLLLGCKLFAQGPAPTYHDASDIKGFKKENIFIGGSLNIGFGNLTFNVGASPEIGYTIAPWLDAGIVTNINYASQRADNYYNGNVRSRSFNYGIGGFAKIYPVNFIFLQVQPEQNWIDYNFKDYNTGQTYKINTKASSILAGIGYSQRIIGQSSFYTALMIDLLRDPNSPYRDSHNAPYPIIRAGFDIYLHASRKK